MFRLHDRTFHMKDGQKRGESSDGHLRGGKGTGGTLSYLEKGKEQVGSFLTLRRERIRWVLSLFRVGKGTGGFLSYLEEGKELKGSFLS